MNDIRRPFSGIKTGLSILIVFGSLIPHTGAGLRAGTVWKVARVGLVRLELNCDLGEGEPAARTRALMQCIHSANIACGGHAGTAHTMEQCVQWARQFNVRIGAHPGLPGKFGRSTAAISPPQLEVLLLQQIGALERIAHSHGLKLHHIKLHGALYHATETSARLRHRYVTTLKRWWPDTIVYALAGGRVIPSARKLGLRCWEEAFADRGYRDDGSLLPRDQPDAIIQNARFVADRTKTLVEQGKLKANSGRWVNVPARTICVHSDSPQAVRMARAVAGALEAARLGSSSSGGGSFSNQSG